MDGHAVVALVLLVVAVAIAGREIAAGRASWRPSK